MGILDLKHPKIKNFILYSCTMCIFGVFIASLGPLVPYLAALEHRQETDYASIFFNRSIGFLIGAALIKVIQKFLSFHQALFAGAIVAGVFLSLFTFTHDFVERGIIIFISSVGWAIIDTYPNVATIECFKKNDLAVWMQILHGIFSVGGILGALIIFLFETKSTLLIGLIIIGVGFFYLRIPSPEFEELRSTISGTSNKTSIKKYISLRSNILMGIIFFFLVGQYALMSVWAASYGILKGFSTKQEGVLYSSVYWISMTLFRFIFAFIGGKPQKKIFLLIVLSIIQSILSYLLINFSFAKFGMLLTSFVFGLATSVLFPLLLVVPKQYDLAVSPSQNSTYLIFAAFGEGALVILGGFLMKTFHQDWFLFCMGLYNLIALGILFAIEHSLRIDQEKAQLSMQEMKSELEMELLEKDTQKSHA